MTEINEYIVKSSQSFSDGIRVLNNNRHKIVVIIDENSKLVGTMTDGDIRRALLKNIHIDASIEEVCWKTPRSCPVETSVNDAKAIMQSGNITFLPVVNESGELVNILFHDENLQVKENPVVIMAGGLGSRLGELTKDCPKPMLTIGGSPILEHILINLKSHGFQNIFITVNYLGEKIKEYFQDGSKLGLKIQYITEEKRMGTAGSLFYLKELIDKPFILMNADIYSTINFEALMEHHQNSKAFITSCTRKYTSQIPYGVMHSDDGIVHSIEEKPTLSFDVGAGVYVVDDTFLEQFDSEAFRDMPDMMNSALEKDKVISLFPLHESWYDIGHVDEYQKVQEVHQEKS